MTKIHDKNITLIGINGDTLDNTPPKAVKKIHNADIIIAPKRLALPDTIKAEIHYWSEAKMSDMIENIRKWKNKNLVIFASGNPMHYGIGATLQKYIPIKKIRIIPAPSAFALAAARLGWAIQDTHTLSLHEKPCETIIPALYPESRIIALTTNAQTPRNVAQMMKHMGFNTSTLHIFENMECKNETYHTLKVDELINNPDYPIHDFHTLAVECQKKTEKPIYPQNTSLPDDAFIHDGQITKHDIRAITLAALKPMPHHRLWDVGAGCGSIAIEWMRHARHAQAIAFEKNTQRHQIIRHNATKLGTPNLEIIAGTAPQSLKNAPPPNAVFIGGGLSKPNLIETCLNALQKNGILIANAVTIEGEAILLRLYQKIGGQCVRIEVSHDEKIGHFTTLKPQLPILQWRYVKQ